MRNGTFKLTQPSRFAALEAEIGSVIAERAAHLRQVLDVGVSTGLTTIELADFLRAKGASAEVIGTDLFVQAHLVEIAPGFRVLSDNEGWPLQYDIAGRPIRAWIRRLDYVTLMVAPRLFARAALRPRLRRMIAEGRSVAVRMETTGPGRKKHRARRKRHLRPHATLRGQVRLHPRRQHPQSELFPGRANTRSHIEHSILLPRPSALMLVARSRGSHHDGTLFELEPDGTFAVRARVGNGSEIEALVLGQGRKLS